MPLPLWRYPVMPMRQPTRFLFSLLPIVILLLAAAVRFHLLGAQSLWHDEGNAYVQATRSLHAIAEHAARDIHPPGYYWLLSIWRRAAGDSEFALRGLSVFVSVLTVAFAYALGARLVGRWVGLLAALFVALNTFSIYYAQEARMYALLALWGTASMWALVEMLHPQSRRAKHDTPSPWGGRWGAGTSWLIFFALFNAAGLYTHYAFPFVMLAQGIVVGVWWVEIHRRGMAYHTPTVLPAYVLANGLTLLLFLPWLPTARDQLTTWPNTGEAIPTAQALSTILGYFAFGITHTGGMTVAVAFFAVFGLLVLTPSPALPARREFRGGVIHMLLPVVWVGVSVGAFLILGLFREANLKFLLPAQVAFALWIGRGVWMLWTLSVDRASFWLRQTPKLAAALGIALIVSRLWAGLNPLYHNPAYRRDDYRAIAAAIQSDSRPGDAIILSAPNQQEVFGYYYNGNAPVFPLPRGLGGDDAGTRAETRAILADYDRIFAVLWGAEERDPNRIVENTLDAEAYEAGSVWYGNVRLVRYAAPAEFATVHDSGVRFGETITLERYAVSAEAVRPGDVLQVRLEWTTAAPMPMRYKVFVQLLNPDGLVVTQHDSEPGGGLYPTTTWNPGETTADHHALLIPNDLTQAHYRLIVGLYNPDNPLERLPVGERDYLSLGQIVIQEP